jgi:site-specific DNA-methyltransferase (adenine-specific)
MARKPFNGTVANNVLEYGTGGINIDGCRVGTDDDLSRKITENKNNINVLNSKKVGSVNDDWKMGRFPANIIFDEEAGKILDEQSGELKFSYAINSSRKKEYNNSSYGISGPTADSSKADYGKKGGASRFFYCPKASKKDRNDGLDIVEQKNNRPIGTAFTKDDNLFDQKANNFHPTVKPTDLMSYLVRLVTPKGGVVLDPFMGSGSTGKASVREGFDFIGIEREDEYMEIAKTRIQHEEGKHKYRTFFDI